MEYYNRLLKEKLNEKACVVDKGLIHEHNFVFKGATRQEICFNCLSCGCVSYLFYEDAPNLFETIILKCLLNDKYISLKDVKRDFIPKKGIKFIGYDDDDDEDDEDDE